MPSGKIAIIGNCQTKGVANCVNLMNASANVDRVPLASPKEALAQYDTMIVQHGLIETIRPRLSEHTRVMLIPSVYYSAFHPDLVYAAHGGKALMSPLAQYNSSIVLRCWLDGVSPTDCIRLFRADVYDHLGFFKHEAESLAAIRRADRIVDVDYDALYRRWRKTACFMYSVNHPKMTAIAELSKALMGGLEIGVEVDRPEQYIADNLLNASVWPTYPQIAERLGVEGSLVFKTSQLASPGKLPRLLDLEQFVTGSYELYDKCDRSAIKCDRVFSPEYDGLRGFLHRSDTQADTADDAISPAPIQAVSSGGGAQHPYRGLPDHQHWRKSIVGRDVFDVDPVVAAPFKITGSNRIASGGSCFAQHIARALKSNGFQYLVPEQPPAGMDPGEAVSLNYGVYSARYGNIYTARQLVQLFDRAYGTFAPVDAAWERSDGAFADPFRPEIEPKGFPSIEALAASREIHLAAVRELFETMDVFVFTLGLTEAWRSRIDGATFPLAPGVTAGAMDPERYEFVNFGVADVVDDLNRFISKLRAINPMARLILTVSPVPLAATYQKQHVLVATTYSKSVLRVAADEIARGNRDVWYFPSYEIITGGFNRGRYFEEDLRSVTPSGVAHVMRYFLAHGTEPLAASDDGGLQSSEFDAGAKIVCEEERLAD